jgi:hypothetical protein
MGAVSASRTYFTNPEATRQGDEGTPPDQHKALAAEYRQLAQRQLAESNEHAEQASWYARFPIYSSAKFRASTIDHCLYFAGKYRNDAQRSEKMTVRHEALAI